MASGFDTRVSSNSNPTGIANGKGVVFTVTYAGCLDPHGPEARDMAVDLVHGVLPGADVRWERTPRVKPEKLTVSVAKGGCLVSVRQRDVSDHYRGEGVNELIGAIQKYSRDAGII